MRAVLPRPRQLVLVEDSEAHDAAVRLPARALACGDSLEAKPRVVHHAIDENDRFTSVWVCHQIASDCTEPLSCWANISTASRTARGFIVGTGRYRLGRDQRGDRSGGLGLEAVDHLRDVGLERVAKQQPERSGWVSDHSRNASTPLRSRTSPGSVVSALRASRAKMSCAWRSSSETWSSFFDGKCS